MKPNLEFDTPLSIEECKHRLISRGVDVKPMWPFFARLQHATAGFTWHGPRGSGLGQLWERPALVTLLQPTQKGVHVRGYFAPYLISPRAAAIIGVGFLIYFLFISKPPLPPVQTILIIGLVIVPQLVFRQWYRPRWEGLAQVLQETLSDNT